LKYELDEPRKQRSAADRGEFTPHLRARVDFDQRDSLSMLAIKMIVLAIPKKSPL